MESEYCIKLTLPELQKIDDVLYHHAWAADNVLRLNEEDRQFVHDLWKNVNGQMLHLTGKDKAW